MCESIIIYFILKDSVLTKILIYKKEKWSSNWIKIKHKNRIKKKNNILKKLRVSIINMLKFYINIVKIFPLVQIYVNLLSYLWICIFELI